jgi:hypothetical protein
MLAFAQQRTVHPSSISTSDGEPVAVRGKEDGSDAGRDDTPPPPPPPPLACRAAIPRRRSSLTASGAWPACTTALITCPAAALPREKDPAAPPRRPTVMASWRDRSQQFPSAGFTGIRAREQAHGPATEAYLAQAICWEDVTSTWVSSRPFQLPRRLRDTETVSGDRAPPIWRTALPEYARQQHPPISASKRVGEREAWGRPAPLPGPALRAAAPTTADMAVSRARWKDAPGMTAATGARMRSVSALLPPRKAVWTETEAVGRQQQLPPPQTVLVLLLHPATSAMATTWRCRLQSVSEVSSARIPSRRETRSSATGRQSRSCGGGGGRGGSV